MNIIGIIPGRMAATRFPGKPMALIAGIPMIGHVYFRSRMSRLLNAVYVATCDNEIADYMRRIGGQTIRTKDSHQRASDRCAEALSKIEKTSRKRADIVVMIQGDEPMVRPDMIEDAIRPLLKERSVLVSNLMERIDSREEFEDPNEIKVVIDRKSFALYFSREPIPSLKKASAPPPMFKQVCIIPFRRDFLYRFNRLLPTSLEKAESVDMMRVLEHGYRVKMVLTAHRTYSVDTPADLKEVERHMWTDDLYRRYEKAAAR